MDNTEQTRFQTNKLIPYSLPSQFRRGELSTVRQLVEGGYDVNSFNKDGDTPLREAAKGGHLDVVKYLVECGADVNHINVSGETVLHNCFGTFQIELCDFIFSSGFIHTDAQDNKGNTLLYLAAENDNEPFVDLLLDKGANVNLSNHEGSTPLLVATRTCCNMSVVERLCSLGAHPECENMTGDTPLVAAIEEGRQDLVRYFIAALNLPLNTTTRRTSSPMSVALDFERWEIIAMMIRAGYQINGSDVDLLNEKLLDAFIDDRELNDFLNKVLSEPRNLTDICCFTIRKNLGRDNLSLKVDDLPLPDNLKDFLKLTHVLRS